MQQLAAATEDRVQAEKIKVLARNLPFTAVTGVGIALLCAFGFADTFPHAWTWAAAFVVIAVLRLGWVALYWRSPDRDAHCRLWSVSLTINVLLSGTMWLIFGLLTFNGGSNSESFLIAIVQTGLTAAGLASLSVHLPAFLAFALPTMAGLILPYAAAGEPRTIVLAMMGVVFVIVLFLSGRSNQAVLSQSIRLRFDNQRLIDELKTANAGAQAASRAKSDFLAMVSHEIRTPMNGVLATAELLSQSNLDAEQKSMVSLVCHSAESLLTIINDILDFSKVEAGRLSLEEARINLRDLMEEVAQVVAPRADDKDLELVVDVDGGLPHELRGDPAKLRQVLLNLAGNAVKFTERGYVLLTATAVDGDLRLTVEDTGPGIPEAAQARLFTPFTQADGAVARRYGGTGLGLSICRRLLDLMGGTIVLDSRPGRGTRLIVTLPLQAVETAPQSAVEAAVEPAVHPLTGLRVAVLAAEPLKGALQRLLATCGAAPAGSAEEADVVVHDGTRPPGPSPAVALVAFHGSAGLPYPSVRKPVRSAELVEAIAVQSGRKAPEGPPLAARPSAFQAPPRDVAEAEGAVVLLVEDNVINRVVISKMLDRLGMVYDLAEDGLDGLERLRRNPGYGLVLTDFHMPRMDGIAMARAFRSETGRSVPILALTADALPDTVRLCHAAGLQGHLPKPLRRDDLEGAIRRWLPRAVELRTPVEGAPTEIFPASP